MESTLTGGRRSYQLKPKPKQQNYHHLPQKQQQQLQQKQTLQQHHHYQNGDDAGVDIDDSAAIMYTKHCADGTTSIHFPPPPDYPPPPSYHQQQQLQQQQYEYDVDVNVDAEVSSQSRHRTALNSVDKNSKISSHRYRDGDSGSATTTQKKYTTSGSKNMVQESMTGSGSGSSLGSSTGTTPRDKLHHTMAEPQVSFLPLMALTQSFCLVFLFRVALQNAIDAMVMCGHPKQLFILARILQSFSR